MKTRAEKYFDAESEDLDAILEDGDITVEEHARRMRDLERECAEEDGE